MIDLIINQCNKPTVEDCTCAINALGDRDRNMLMHEFKKHPDSRFGDNLLIALSLY
jgi:hypothetical protein